MLTAQGLKRISICMVLILFLLLGCIGCNAGITPIPPPPGQLILASNLRQVDHISGLELSSIDEATYTYDTTSTYPNNISVGDIILSTEDGGYLRRVEAISKLEPELVLETSQANMADAFVEGRYQAQLDFSGGHAGAAQRTGDVEYNIFDPVVLDIKDYIQEPLYDDGFLKVEVADGGVTFTPLIDIEAYYTPWEGITEFKSTIKGKLDFDLDMLATAHAEYHKGDELKVCPTMSFPWAVGLVGGFVNIDFYVGYDINGEIDGKLTGGFDTNLTIETGAKYDHGVWTPIGTAKHTFNIHEPECEVKANASIQGYIRPEVSITFYNVAGLGLDCKPYLELVGEGELIPNPYLEYWLYLGVGADFHVKVDIFGFYELADWTYPVLDPMVFRWELIHERIDFTATGIINVTISGIPGGANRICLFANGDNIIPAIPVMANNVTIPLALIGDIRIPAGEDRLISAYARYVDSLPPGQMDINLNPTYVELLEGEVVASGNADAFNLDSGETLPIEIVLDEPADSDGVNDVDPGGSQFDPTYFPTVIVLQALTDQNGDPINNLTAANFRILEQPAGFPGPAEAVITDVRYIGGAGGAGNISVVLCLDKSGSMDGSPVADLKTAAKLFVSLMQPGDQAEVVNFSSGVYVDQPFTQDKDLLEAAINKDYGYTTALYDAIYQSIYDAGQQLETGRKAVIAMTDGHENNSYYHDLNDIYALADAELVPVYTIGLGSVDEYVLNNIASNTGGVYYYAPSSSELADIYQEISERLFSQIRITYESPDPIDHDPDIERNVWVYLTNYVPLTSGGDILIYETTYWE